MFAYFKPGDPLLVFYTNKAQCQRYLNFLFEHVSQWPSKNLLYCGHNWCVTNSLIKVVALSTSNRLYCHRFYENVVLDWTGHEGCCEAPIKHSIVEALILVVVGPGLIRRHYVNPVLAGPCFNAFVDALRCWQIILVYYNFISDDYPFIYSLSLSPRHPWTIKCLNFLSTFTSRIFSCFNLLT